MNRCGVSQSIPEITDDDDDDDEKYLEHTQYMYLIRRRKNKISCRFRDLVILMNRCRRRLRHLTH
ncbi:hypothetical protein DERP_010332 [Dermatophagoides pteronyssinus]|uniref:Uncharacterized protein n=1 Tax=Dermatophagoides pteronyssinus TaxID=6956 RepID=A0ABQ8IYT7_DERPT|nr:hypothetical protein DERP_010332 [Dermatophagoides pteronyssinus]